jgi:ribose/xylose/arabinose/galactoside ABC-type transport system permease subunit
MVPNVAPIVLAGLGMTGIVCCGAIDLSIGAILGLSGTVFGILCTSGDSAPRFASRRASPRRLSFRPTTDSWCDGCACRRSSSRSPVWPSIAAPR